MIGRLLRHPDAPPVLFLLGVALVVHAPFLVAGEGFLYGDVLAHYRGPQEFAFSRIADGGALWCPLLGLGHPVFAAAELPVAYPPALVAETLLGFDLAIAWLLPFHGALGAIFTYFLARRLRLSRAASAMAGVGFAWSGWFLGHQIHTMFLWAAAWLPGLLLGIDDALGRGRRRFPALLSIATAATLLAGSAPVAFLSAVTCGAVALWRLAAGPEARRRVLRLAGGVAIGVGIASVVLLPTLLHAGATDRGGTLSAGRLLALSYPPTQAATLVSPFALGWSTPGAAVDPLRYFGAPNFEELSAYVGAVTLLLAGAGACSRRRRRLAVPLAIGVGATLLLALGAHTPAGDLVAKLPGFSHFRILPRFLLPGSLGLCLLAGIGLDAVTASATWTRRRLSAAFLALGALTAAAAVLALLLEAELVEAARARIRETVIGAAGRDAPAEYYLAFPRALLHTVRDSLWRPALLCMFAAAVLRFLSAHRVAAALALLLAVDLATMHHEYAGPRTPPDPAPLARALRAAGVDTVTTTPRRDVNDLRATASLGANVAPGYGLATPIAISQLRLSPVQALLAEAAPREEGAGLRLDERSVRALRLLGVDALLHDATERPLAVPGLRRLVEVDGVVAFAVPDPRPRAWCVGGVGVIPGETAVEASLAEDIVAGRAAVVPAPVRGVDHGDADADVRIVEERPARLVLVADPARPSLLVVRSAHASGWSAEVDGRPVSIVRANVAFSAVPVPAGPSRVVMEYRPPGLLPGAVLSALSLLLLGALSIRGRGRAGEPG